MRQQLYEKTKDEIFLVQFKEHINAELQKVTAGTKYAQQVDPFRYQNNPTLQRLTRFKVEGDDAHNTKKWEALMTDCAYYYDKPTIEQEIMMKKDLQYKYDDLFANGIFPRLQSRKDLLTWACYQREDARKATAPEDQREAINDRCEDYSRLLTTYGPSYSTLKEKLGYVKGLFDDTD